MSVDAIPTNEVTKQLQSLVPHMDTDAVKTLQHFASPLKILNV